MSDYSVVRSKARYVGAWASGTTYNQNQIVKGSDGRAYCCLKDNVSGAAKDPVTDTTNWELFLPTSGVAAITTTQVDRASSTTFGISAGSTYQWRGQEWTLEVSGTQITLVRMKSNCNCNCNCNCSVNHCTQLNCACPSTQHCSPTSNCDCAYDCNCCNAPYNCSYACNCCDDGQGCHYVYEFPCTSDCCHYVYAFPCNCATRCNCTVDCNCVHNCDCNCDCNCSAI